MKGNTDDTFCINSKGVLSVAKPLNREKVPSYTLDATVTLGDKTDSTVVQIDVMDVNDNKPVFEQIVYTVQVSENAGMRV